MRALGRKHYLLYLLLMKTPVSIDGRTNKEEVAYTYNRLLLSYKKGEILPFATTRMDLEGISLSKISQVGALMGKDKYHMNFTCMWNIKNQLTSKKAKTSS